METFLYRTALANPAERSTMRAPEGKRLQKWMTERKAEDVLSFSFGSGADPVQHQGAGHFDQADPDAPGGGGTGGRTDPGPGRAGCADGDGVPHPAQ